MKIVLNADLRVGTRRFADGDEVDLPDRFAQALVNAGKATAANDKPAKKQKKAADPVEEERPKKDYKTRQIKAEDSD